MIISSHFSQLGYLFLSIYLSIHSCYTQHPVLLRVHSTSSWMQQMKVESLIVSTAVYFLLPNSSILYFPETPLKHYRNPTVEQYIVLNRNITEQIAHNNRRQEKTETGFFHINTLDVVLFNIAYGTPLQPVRIERISSEHNQLSDYSLLYRQDGRYISNIVRTLDRREMREECINTRLVLNIEYS